MTFQDHFSRQAQGYTQFRPRYPRELFEYLQSLVARHQRAWDCGCGNGQAAEGLAEVFDEVIATDPSSRQIAEARPMAHITYLVATAESCPLESHCIDPSHTMAAAYACRSRRLTNQFLIAYESLLCFHRLLVNCRAIEP